MRTARFLQMRREAYGFALGSLCFLVGATPLYADAVGAVVANATFAVGSVLFTGAALLQLLLSGRRPPRAASSRADAYDWWAAAIQLGGTVLFNVSTFRAWRAAVARPDEVGVGWTADAWGSLAFLVSSALALAALSRRHELWDVLARTPGAVWLNAAGSVAFGASAAGAYVVPATDELLSLWWTLFGTWLGALCFLVAAVLTRPSVTAPEERAGISG
ncbi:YrhK family protein [Demequina mangrovi]|uniref:Uncharacterized protein n=1 Tax=Demequina mangrovi TaxID=1043493 RepID=A0A1H6XDT3_9MICO|nr:YrhK family protein [Demequina mangrovi]SEJ23050.1 hypothetical protein SAMN05421637_1245 [Demequina mangrovi]